MCCQMSLQVLRPREHIVTLFALFFSAMCFWMFRHSRSTRRFKVTVVAFVWLFSNVRFHMLLHTACMSGCIITLVAFEWLFSTVCPQMFPQFACIEECIPTLVALVWLLSIVLFSDQRNYIDIGLIHLIHHQATTIVSFVRVVSYWGKRGTNESENSMNQMLAFPKVQVFGLKPAKINQLLRSVNARRC